jgi:hypothetical protein
MAATIECGLTAGEAVTKMFKIWSETNELFNSSCASLDCSLLNVFFLWGFEVQG